MYTPPNQKAILSCEEIEAAEKARMYRRFLAERQNMNSGLFGWEGFDPFPEPVPGPYQSDSLNKKLRDAKLFLERYGNRPLTKWGLYSRPGQR